MIAAIKDGLNISLQAVGGLKGFVLVTVIVAIGTRLVSFPDFGMLLWFIGVGWGVFWSNR